ncbi:MAG: protein-glutamate O-methyltransferase CheR [Nitrospirae bacterium]|nr:protein-glutamate O-methyltransferase CheR [Nitrospirota bacterium]
MQLVMDDNDFAALKTLMEDEFGLSLKAHTRESFARKIKPRLEALRMSSMKEYLHYLANDPLSKIELHDLPSFVMNTESYFLREFAQFELFLDLYRQKRKNKVLRSDKSLSILSAGCSAGQEPYSIAMLLRNQPEPLHGWDVRILGLDINVLALEKARSGVYSAYSLRGSNIDLIEKYFKRTYSETCETPKECFRLMPEIISSIEYMHGNILQPLVLKGISNLDFIFCRNLLMYMSKKAADQIALSLWEALADDGYLFIGQSETLRKRDDLFEPMSFPGVTIYRKNRSAAAV